LELKEGGNGFEFHQNGSIVRCDTVRRYRVIRRSHLRGKWEKKEEERYRKLVKGPKLRLRLERGFPSSKAESNSKYTAILND
jgi:hypothetical protein